MGLVARLKRAFLKEPSGRTRLGKRRAFLKEPSGRTGLRKRGAFFEKNPREETGLKKDKKGFLGVDILIILLILLGLLAIVSIAYFGFRGNILWLINQIRNFMRFGNSY